MSHDGPAPGETSIFMHGVKPIGQISVKDVTEPTNFIRAPSETSVFMHGVKRSHCHT